MASKNIDQDKKKYNDEKRKEVLDNWSNALHLKKEYTEEYRKKLENYEKNIEKAKHNQCSGIPLRPKEIELKDFVRNFKKL